MDRNQQKTMESFGFAIVDMPDLKTVPRMTYITPDGRELPNLPADAYHLNRYLSRGFKPKLANPSGEVAPTKPKREYKHTRKFLKKQAQKNL